MSEKNASVNQNKNNSLFRFVVYSIIGIFMFFVPITIGGKNTIPLDHIVTYIQKIPYYGIVYGSVMIILGVVLPFINGTWNKTKTKLVFSIINILAIPFLIMAVFKVGPASLLAPNMIPFIFNKIVVPVTTIVPVGSVFLALITGYGLMEFVGVFMRPIMKPIWKTPGRSAIDAVASFVGSYSIALLITNRVYREGKYTTKEAAIIATGFSTVSATFMVIVANNLGIMNMWTTYFAVTAIVTFIVTAITARIYPLRNKSNDYYKGQKGEIEQDVKGNKLTAALEIAKDVADEAPSLWESTKTNFIDGIKLAINMAPSLMAIGTLGLILAYFTPVFKGIGVIFYPFTLLMGLKEPMHVAMAISTSIAEMLLPVSFVTTADFVTRFTVGVVCVSEILFFSASIPCMMATDIPLTMKDYIL
ncbi:MAG: YjiH family protein, partial [Clostridiaceae bacterium]